MCRAPPKHGTAADIAHVIRDIVITKEITQVATGPITIQDTTPDAAGVAAILAMAGILAAATPVMATAMTPMMATTVGTITTAMTIGMAMTDETRAAAPVNRGLAARQA